MKSFTWVNRAVQAFENEGIGDSGDCDRHNGQQRLYVGGKSYRTHAADIASYIPKTRNSKTRPMLDPRPDYNQSVPAVIWDDTFEPENSRPLPKPDFGEQFNEDLKNHRAEYEIATLQKGFAQDTDSEHSSSNVSENHVEDQSSTERKSKMSATIFQSSTTIPITITVTIPIEDIPKLADNPVVLQKDSTSIHLTPLNSKHFNNIDTNHLMPPTDHQLDPGKLHKVQEFREIRKWLISFINSKGDKFPRKLRLRIMDLYCIREFHLAPEIVTKFKAEMRDEGVELDTQNEAVDYAASLSILGAAFRSQIEEATPRKEKVVALPVPPSWQRQGSLPKKTETKKLGPSKITKEYCSGTSAKEELDIGVVRSWMGPFISTSTSSRNFLLPDQQCLRRTYSTPNLKYSRPHFKSTDSTHSAPGLRPRGSTFTGEQEKPMKRNNIISGAFGAMKDAMTGRSSRREKKIQQKKS